MPLWEIPTTDQGTFADRKQLMRTIWAFSVPNEVPKDNYPDNGVKYPSRMIASDGGLAYTADQVQGMPLLGKAGGRSSGEYQLGGRAFGDKSATRLFQLEYMLDDILFTTRSSVNWTGNGWVDHISGKCGYNRFDIPSDSVRGRNESSLATYLQNGKLATTGPTSSANVSLQPSRYTTGGSTDGYVGSCRVSPVSAYVEDYRHFNGLTGQELRDLEQGLWAADGHVADYSRVFHFNRSYYPAPGQVGYHRLGFRR